MLGVERLLPYAEWRPGQRDLAFAVEEAVSSGRVLLVRYPTGTGKTLAVLAGSLAAALNEELTVFYAVRTITQFQAPLRELHRLSEIVSLRAVALVSKQRLCPLRGMSSLSYDEFLRYCSYLSSRHECPFAKTHESPDTLEDVPTILTPVVLRKLSKRTGVCPYALAIKSCRDARVIVGTYSYMFDPEVARTFLAETGLSLDRLVIIVDEAHNLPDYLSSTLSAELKRSWVKGAKREVLKVYRGEGRDQLLEGLSRLERYMTALEKKAKDSPVEVSSSDILSLSPPLAMLEEAARAVEARYAREKLPLRTYLRRVYKFMKRITEANPRYVTVGLVDEEFKLVHACASPAHAVAETFRSSHSVIMMSGTLPPREIIEFYTGVEPSRVKEIAMPNPFAKNVTLVCTLGISSRYSERGEELYKAMATAIDAVYASVRHGVVLAVFPSYDFMKRVRLHLQSTPVFIERETTSLSDIERAILNHDRLLVLVNAWGKVAEGIEFTASGRSIVRAVVMAGLPVPEPTPVRKKTCELMSIFLSSREKGFEYTFLIPAAMKLIQAIGRGVRGPQDKLFVAVLDERVKTESVKKYIESYGYKVNFIKGVGELALSLDQLFGEPGND